MHSSGISTTYIDANAKISFSGCKNSENRQFIGLARSRDQIYTYVYFGICVGAAILKQDCRKVFLLATLLKVVSLVFFVATRHSSAPLQTFSIICENSILFFMKIIVEDSYP